MTIMYFIFAALALGILVFIHELGHFIVAKRMGMTVEVFSIGFGKPILRWRWSNVDWQLGWLPFGGYVKIAGMEFGKKEKSIYSEPHEIPNGFFSKSPWQRIAVALAGPFANFILAFLIFAAIWAMGGREKSFSDFTQVVGWVDPKSELYADGIRPGDMITEYNGNPFTNSKDLIYAAMLGGKKIHLKGYHVDYENRTKTPFSYTVDGYNSPQLLNGILTSGITSTASYLIYDKYPNGNENPLTQGSPMEGSGLTYKDRLIWADGSLLFSLEELNHIVNEGRALLTVKRGDQTILTRQPRVLASDLIMPAHLRNELMDWQYEIGLKGRWQDLYVLPYVMSTEGYIETALDFIDEESKSQAYPLHPYSKELESPLQAGDRIIAVDGMPVDHGYQILEAIQAHKVSLIVQKDVSAATKTSWKDEDKFFLNSINYSEIEAIAKSIGKENSLREFGDYKLLIPAEPKRIDDFDLTESSKLLLEEEYQKQRAKVEKIKDQEKRRQAYRYLEKNREKLLLGIPMQDLRVDYNPNPFVLFGNVAKETWQTLKALFTGNLSPKWISGPVGIVQVIQYGWKIGVGEALFWIGAISMNLGVMNLLPVPVLDGGYICLSLWEVITRRRVKAKTMERLIIPFVVLLIGFLVFLTFQDISRFF